MKVGKFLVTLRTPNGRDRSDVWDGDAPMGLGHPFRFVLERSESSVIIRRIGGGSRGIESGSVTRILAASLAQGSPVQLPGDTGTISIRSLQPIKPAYLSEGSPAPTPDGKQPQLLAFEGARRIVIGCTRIHSAFVAHLKGMPLFTVYMSPDGYRVKPLLSGVSLKLKGRKSMLGKPGEAWALTHQEMATATVTRGLNWWRFSMVPALGAEDASSIAARPDSEAVWFRRACVSVALLCCATLLSVRFFPPAPMTAAAPKAPSETIVRFKPKVQLLKPREIQVAETPPPLESRLEAVPVQDAPAAPPGASKSVAQKSPEIKAPAAAKARANESAKKVAALRDLLGGAKSLAKKAADSNINVSEPVTANSVADLFNPTGAAVAKTEVAPVFSAPTTAKIEVMGGRGLAEDQASGYGSEVNAKFAGQGKSLVAMGSGSESVVEEGLSKEEVSAVIRSHMSEVRYCYESALLYQPNIHGKLQIGFTISSTGSVSRSAIQETTLTEKKLGECVLEKLRTWAFPKPKGRSEVTVSYPFLFKTLGRD